MSTTVPGTTERILSLGICLGLAVAVWVIFGQTLGFDFVNYDDGVYVYENPQVRQGLSLGGVEWAFSHSVDYNWHPLTMISYMVDCQLHGPQPGGYHFTNILLHGAAAIFLFLVLRGMTGALWRSALAAALFAVHPLHVESVAWVAERKDVLSGLFFMLTLGAYVWYVREPRRLSRYLTVIFFFALALMSKPTVVPLPCLLLLLDYWPLNRFPTTAQACIPPRLILEKIPLFVLSAAVCLTTLTTQKDIIAPLPFITRIGNACASCVIYLWQMVYPKDLAAYYPLREQGLPAWVVSGSFLVLAVISALAFAWRRKRPWLLVGWLWNLGMLVPVIGLVQSGLRAHADRYTYLPQIGLYLIIAWMATDLVARRRYGRLWLGILASVVILALILCARIQVSFWKNNQALWQHALAVSGDTEVADNNLGMDFFQKGQWDEAIDQFERALKINADYYSAHDNLGVALAKRGRLDEAMSQFRQALKINPDDVSGHNNLGMALVQKGQLDEGIAQFRQALKINPDDVSGHNNLGMALVQKGQLADAIIQYQLALKINPDFGMAHVNLGIALVQKGQLEEAIAQYQQALKINPNDASAHSNLGYALAQKGQWDDAIRYYERALEIDPGFDLAHINLGKAFWHQGKVDEAIAQYQQALRINPNVAVNYIYLGNAFFHQGKVDEAIAQYQQALKINPDSDMAHNDLGIALDKKGQSDEAIAQFLQALKISPDYALGHLNLGNAYLHEGKLDDAIAQYQQALKTDPDLEQAHSSLGYALMRNGQLDEAVGHYERALDINPANAGRCNHLAWLLATHPRASDRNGSKAVELARQLNRLSGGKDPIILQTLAAAYAETGQFPEAISTAQQALQLAHARGNPALVDALNRQIECYQAGSPFRDAGLTNAVALPHP